MIRGRACCGWGIVAALIVSNTLYAPSTFHHAFSVPYINPTCGSNIRWILFPLLARRLVG